MAVFFKIDLKIQFWHLQQIMSIFRYFNDINVYIYHTKIEMNAIIPVNITISQKIQFYSELLASNEY